MRYVCRPRTDWAVLFVLFSLVTLVFLPSPAAAQTGTWTAHTPLRQVNAMATTQTTIWVATTGGVFGYTPSSESFESYTVIDGLHSVSAEAITYDDGCACLWIGYASGAIDRLDPATGTIRTFRDIERADQFRQRSVNRLRVQGDTLLVATGFGLVVFDTNRLEVRDAYSRLGTLPANTPVYDVLLAPTPTGEPGFWVGTDAGVAYAPLDAPNLQDPTAWTVETDGLPNFQPQAYALATFGGTLYAGSSNDLYRRTPGGSYERLFVTSTPVTTLLATETQLLGIEQFKLVGVRADGSGVSYQSTAFQTPRDVIVDATGAVWLGDAVVSLLPIDLPENGAELTVGSSIAPPGPADGQFADLVVDAEGALWAGGIGGGNTGFYHLSPDGVWTNYVGSNFPELQAFDRAERIHIDGAGNAWSGSREDGIAQVAPDGTITRYTDANSSLRPIAGFPDQLRVGGIASDEDDRLWVTTIGAATPIHVRDPDGTWTPLPLLTGNGLTAADDAYGRIMIDTFDQKWIIIRDDLNFEARRGFIVLDTGNTPLDPADDVFRYFNAVGAAGQGLPDLTVNTIIPDRGGLVWIATNRGPAFMANTGIVAQDASATPIWPQWADRSRGTFVLFGLQINDIAVDPANRLWLATNEGAWLIEAVEGGYELVTHFTADNSPLLADQVLRIAVDDLTGRVFFNTEAGLVSYAGDALRPASSATDLFVYPNPVVITDTAAPNVFIEGLVESTDLRILTPAGGVVASLRTRGGRARWDGRDLEGNFVRSGIYLVIAVGRDGEGTAVGKVAVIR